MTKQLELFARKDYLPRPDRGAQFRGVIWMTTKAGFHFKLRTPE